MSFEKIGTPQPIKIASGLCEICGSKSGNKVVKGKILCNDCASKEEDK